MSVTRNNPPFMLASAIAAFCVSLASCGGGGGDASAPAANTSSDQTLVRLGLPKTVTSPSASQPETSAPAASAPAQPVDTSAPAVSTSSSASQPTATPASTTKAIGPAPLVISVATNGNDAWTGLLPAPNVTNTDGPLLTLAKAQAVARVKLQAMTLGTLPRAPIHVDIQDGTYVLPSQLNFDENDSGVSGSPVVYEAVNAGKVVLSGGLSLTTRSTTSTTFTYGLPSGAAQPTWSYGQQLYVGGKRAVLARQPNEGTYYYVTSSATVANEAAPVGRTAFKTSADAQAWVNALPADQFSGAIVNMYQSWTTGRHHFDGTAAPGTLQLSPAAKWPFLISGSNQRYFIENVKSALDAPGEWYGDASGITYLRRANDPATAPTAVLANLDRLIAIGGHPTQGKWAEFIEFRGLQLQHTRLQTPSTGLMDSQAGSLLGAAMEVDGARNVTIDNCRFSHLGSYALWLRNDVRNTTASNNTVYDAGAGGVKVGLGTQVQTDTNATSFNTITGNTITDLGHVMPGGGVGIWIGQTWDNTVTRNLVSNTTYSGISVGWTWGYGTATSGRNKISNNELINIGQGQLSDLGGVYALGISPGSEISGNLIREVRSYGGYGPSGSFGGWGIYLDEGSSQMLVQNNVVIGTDNGGFLLHYGHTNTVSNNLFAWGDMAEIGVANTDPATALSVSGNLIMPGTTIPFDRYAAPVDTTYSANSVTQTPAAANPDLTKCSPGCTMSGATLGTTTAAKGITLLNAPPAIQTMVTATLAGAGPATTTLPAASVVNGSRPLIVLGPPLPLTLDIANAPLGTQPTGMTYSPPGNMAAIQMVSQADAPAGRCLRFADNSTFLNKFDPYAWATLNHASGTSDATFTLWNDSNTNFYHEWRDSAVPYHIGPSFTITSAGISIGGKVVMPVTLNSWNTFHVRAALGSGAGTWSLDVTDSLGNKRSLTNLSTGANWTTLTWMGFVSNAMTTTNACLGSLTVSNQ